MIAFTVKKNDGDMLSHEIRTYREMITELGLELAPEKQTQQPDGRVRVSPDHNCLCRWESIDSDQSFCAELANRTQSGWSVAEVEIDDKHADRVN